MLWCIALLWYAALVCCAQTGSDPPLHLLDVCPLPDLQIRCNPSKNSPYHMCSGHKYCNYIDMMPGKSDCQSCTDLCDEWYLRDHEHERVLCDSHCTHYKLFNCMENANTTYVLVLKQHYDTLVQRDGEEGPWIYVSVIIILVFIIFILAFSHVPTVQAYIKQKYHKCCECMPQNSKRPTNQHKACNGETLPSLSIQDNPESLPIQDNPESLSIQDNPESLSAQDNPENPEGSMTYRNQQSNGVVGHNTEEHVVELFEVNQVTPRDAQSDTCVKQLDSSQHSEPHVDFPQLDNDADENNVREPLLSESQLRDARTTDGHTDQSDRGAPSTDNEEPPSKYPVLVDNPQDTKGSLAFG